MATLILTPEAEMHIVCTQGTLFPATEFTFTDKDTGNTVDMSIYEQTLKVWDQYGGSLILEWNTADDSITISGDDNEVITLGEKSALIMDIAARKYIYDWVFTIPGGQPVRYFTGNLIVKSSG